MENKEDSHLLISQIQSYHLGDRRIEFEASLGY